MYPGRHNINRTPTVYCYIIKWEKWTPAQYPLKVCVSHKNLTGFTVETNVFKCCRHRGNKISCQKIKYICKEVCLCKIYYHSYSKNVKIKHAINDSTKSRLISKTGFRSKNTSALNRSSPILPWLLDEDFQSRSNLPLPMLHWVKHH